jgi:Rod binding domain-containing protein
MEAISIQPNFGAAKAANQPNDELRQAFTQFVGEAFYGQMIKAMRSTCGKPAYFHGGRGEEVFRAQLDQTMAEHMTEATADRFADPLFQRQFPNLSVA